LIFRSAFTAIHDPLPPFKGIDVMILTYFAFKINKNPYKKFKNGNRKFFKISLQIGIEKFLKILYNRF